MLLSPLVYRLFWTARDPTPFVQSGLPGALAALAPGVAAGFFGRCRLAQLQPRRAYQRVMDLAALGRPAPAGFAGVRVGHVLRQRAALALPLAPLSSAMASVGPPAPGDADVAAELLAADWPWHAAWLLAFTAVYRSGVWLEFNFD